MSLADCTDLPPKDPNTQFKYLFAFMALIVPPTVTQTAPNYECHIFRYLSEKKTCNSCLYLWGLW